MAIISYPLESVTFAFRTACFNTYLGLGTVDGAKYLAIEKHITRTLPDILTLSEQQAADVAKIRDNLAPDNGYPHIGFADFSTSYNQAVLSKFPITKMEYITSPADEYPRPPLYCEFDMGALDKVIGIYTVHMDTWCISGPCGSTILTKAEANRAMEWIRIRADFEARLRANPNLEIIVQGDWNDSPDKAQTAEITSYAGGGYAGTPGSDIKFPILYSNFPLRQTAAGRLTLVQAQDLDGSKNTLWANDPNTAFDIAWGIDFMAWSSGLTGQVEILSSEATQTGGLAKYGTAMAAGTSQDASDHKMVFGDFKILAPRDKPTKTFFDGQANHVEVPDYAVLRVGGTNIEVRASFTAPDLTDVRLVSKRGTFNFNYGWQVSVLSGVLTFGYTTGGTNATSALVGSYVLSAGETYDIMVQYDGVNVMFWVDGVKVESVPLTDSVFVSSAKIQIGAINDPASTFSLATIWDVQVGTINNPIAAWHNTTWVDLIGINDPTKSDGTFN